jgi:hypothetical protein
MLIINAKGIRYAFKWKLKWEDIQSYHLDKGKDVLHIQVKGDVVDKQVVGINKKKRLIVLESIDRYAQYYLS